MISLPIPIYVAITLAFLALRHLRSDRLSKWLLAFISTIAIQSLIVGLKFGFEISIFYRVLPITLPLIPVLAWFVFLSHNIRDISWKHDALNILPFVFSVLAMVFIPDALDAVFFAITLFYGLMILKTLATRKGDLPRARLDSGPMPSWIWLVLAFMLIISAIVDGIVSLSFFFGYSVWAPIIVSIFSSLNLLVIGGLSFIEFRGDSENEVVKISDETQLQDTEIVERLDALLDKDRIYLDPDLTLSRLAKRLHLPIKQLSASINRKTGFNISRYVNQKRIHHACELMKSGTPVTNVIYESGFSTKSNFHREFLRVHGAAPTEWLKSKSNYSKT